jgi:hypothetical protein
VAGAGPLACALHTWFLRAGRPEFDAPASIALRAAVLMASVAQIGVEIGSRRRRAPAP